MFEVDGNILVATSVHSSFYMFITKLIAERKDCKVGILGDLVLSENQEFITRLKSEEDLLNFVTENKGKDCIVYSVNKDVYNTIPFESILSIMRNQADSSCHFILACSMFKSEYKDGFKHFYSFHDKGVSNCKIRDFTTGEITMLDFIPLWSWYKDYTSWSRMLHTIKEASN